MTIIEKILSAHSSNESVKPGDIVDIEIDTRVARDFGGANVVKNLKDFSLAVADPAKTFFTFDCNPTGSDQKYAVNQHICRLYARDNNIRVYDIDAGIGTHLLIDQGLVKPGSTAVSTDSHANILGAIGAFGQGMGDMDIAASWHNGKIWFSVPPSVKINLNGEPASDISSKDIVLNLLKIFGANSLLGYSIEIGGEYTVNMSVDDRITISSMATEMGAIIILFAPNEQVIEYCTRRSSGKVTPYFADPDAYYEKIFDVDITQFRPMVALPGEPHNTHNISELPEIKIDSAFIGSCTNGRMSDFRAAAEILRRRKVAPGVVLKIVPATDEIWKECLREGLIDIFKKSGCMVSNAGCAGCAAGQVGQNGPGEITISTGNRNFAGKQGKGSVYLASPAVVAASAVAGYITTPDRIPQNPLVFGQHEHISADGKKTFIKQATERALSIKGKVWVINRDNIDTDMIFHNRYLAITNIAEMGQYTLDNLKGYEDFAKKVKPGDILFTGKNFGCGSSRQQAVDCFASLGVAAIVAESFGSIYERNAINAAFPVLTCSELMLKDVVDGDEISVDFVTGVISNMRSGEKYNARPFPKVQTEIFLRGGLLGN